jgi:hypothetical protein
LLLEALERNKDLRVAKECDSHVCALNKSGLLDF